MKVLLYIIIAFLIPWSIVYIVIFIREGIKIARGEISREDLEHNADVYKRYKRIKRLKKQSKGRGGSLHFLSYPSPLNNWGLWK